MHRIGEMEIMFSPISKIYRLISKSVGLKLITMLLITITVPLGIWRYISYRNSIDSIIQEYINSNIKIATEINKSVDMYFSQLDNLTLSLYSDNDFMLDLYAENDYFRANPRNVRLLSKNFILRDDIEYIYFYTFYDNLLYSISRDSHFVSAYPAFEDEPWLKETLESMSGEYVRPMFPFDNFLNIGSYDGVPTISVNRVIRSISNNKTYALLSINVNLKQIDSLMASIANEDEIVLVQNRQGQTLYQKTSDEALHPDYTSFNEYVNGQKTGYFYASPDGKDSIVVFTRIVPNYSIFKAIPVDSLFRSANNDLSVDVISGIFIILFVMLLASFFSYRITTPIKHLLVQMERLGEGDLEANVSSNSSDEIGMLSTMFNQMTAQLKGLINSEYRVKIAMRNAQLKALQAQINPHFFNNTLQSIGALALQKGAGDVYSSLVALADMTEYSIRSKKDMVPLEIELQYMRNYLSLQKIRFQDDLEVGFSIHDDTLDFHVPRLILQPLIENSIMHGMDENKTRIHIQISSYQEGGYLILCVEDTGKGIDAIKMAEINEWLRADIDPLDNEGSMGIYNVINRIKLYYGDNADIDIAGDVDTGIAITIKISVGKDNAKS